MLPQMRLEMSRFLVLVLLSQKASGAVVRDVYVENGKNATLPCEASSSIIKAIEWTRPDLKYPEYVLFYSDGRTDKTHQNPSFADRVELKDTQIKNGNLTIVLRNVSKSDNGTYECRVSAKRSKRAIIKGDPVETIRLHVTDSGSTNGNPKDGDKIIENPKEGDYTRGYAVSAVCLGLFSVVILAGWRYKGHKTKKSDLSAADEAVGDELI